MERCRALIEEFSEDIKMTFGLDKCAVLYVKAGKQIYSSEVKTFQSLSEKKVINIWELSKETKSCISMQKIMRKKNSLNV